MNMLSTFLSIVASFLKIGEQLSPAINAWILANIPAHKQMEIDQRMRRCKRTCRRGKFDADMIRKQVALDFSDNDISDTQRGDITSLLDYELLKK